MEGQSLVPLLLLLFFSAGARWPAAVAAVESGPHPHRHHPVVLLPGFSCSQLDAQLTHDYTPPPTAPGCGAARKGKGWFRLWENYTAVQDPALVPCYADQLRLVYDPVAGGDYRNAPGVETSVVAFGTTRGFGNSHDPARRNSCMEKLVMALEAVGYREGENLFGAPYDFRYAAAAPGHASTVFSGFLSRLRHLVEHASERNGNRPVILVTHSLGGVNVLEFLRRSPIPWRRRYVKHLVMLSVGIDGAVWMMQSFASDLAHHRQRQPPSSSSPAVFGNNSRTFRSSYLVLPTPRVYGRTPLVITRAKNYSAHDMSDFLASVGLSEDEVARYRARELPVTLGYKAPLVPVTCVNGVGVPTAKKLAYWDGDFGAEPEIIEYGDGDGRVNVETVLAMETVIGKDPNQGFFKSVLIPNVTHIGMISDDSALIRVVAEVLEANRPCTIIRSTS